MSWRGGTRDLAAFFGDFCGHAWAWRRLEIEQFYSMGVVKQAQMAVGVTDRRRNINKLARDE